ncbi:amidase domain-containing protein [Bacillus sp. DJP31]|uniref:amidase domain-containing protein n=1 Tax=Bacillus sp. DJP31 TaxID=3409789 RepID=UPI003BB6D23D
MIATTLQTSPTLAAGEVNLQEKNSYKSEDISFYQTSSNDLANEKKVAMVEHKEAIKIIKEYIQTNEFSIKSDLDNPTYQQFVLSLGGSFDEFNEEDMKKIVSFVKFIDLYENHSKNGKLKEYKNKLNSKNTLSSQENIELGSLLPLSSDDISTQNNVTPISNEVSISTVYSNGYNNIAARDYAYKWWTGRNPSYGYYANKNGCSITNESCWNDCTNFVSQALYAGGMRLKYGSSYTSSASWSYGVVPSYSWGGAQNFYLHWKNRAGVTSSSSALQTGDAVNADFQGDGDMEHTAIITRNTGSASSQKYLTQHTSDKKETTTLANWYNSGYKVYGYEMDKASN